MRNTEAAVELMEAPVAVDAARTSTVERHGDPRLHSMVVGVLGGLSSDGIPVVDFPGNLLGCLPLARTTVPLAASDVGRSVVLLFEHADPRRPVVMGVLQPTGVMAGAGQAQGPRPELDIRIDGQALRLTAEKEIVLSCGDASITLTRAGKVLIRGEYVLSRSSGVNRIKGASVQIN